jgi:hypothetical protein
MKKIGKIGKIGKIEPCYAVKGIFVLYGSLDTLTSFRRESNATPQGMAFLFIMAKK